MCELDKIIANASKFNLILLAENRHDIYTGQILSFLTYATMWLMPNAHGQDGLLHFKVEFCVNSVSV